MRVLVTGITGFAGSHLADFLVRQKGVRVYGLRRRSSKLGNIRHLAGKIELYPSGTDNFLSLRRIVARIKPDRIFHLAAQSFVPLSWEKPAETLTSNILGELYLFEAVRGLGLKPLIHIAASSEEYGAVARKEIPIRETAPLAPLSPYGVSKVAQDLLGYQYQRSFKMNIIRTRAFSHTGPRQREDFVASNFAKQVALIEKGRQEPVIYVGNLEAVRDFTDVRDVVRAYWLALQKGAAGEVYNICSGKGHKIKEIVDLYLRRSRVKIKVKKDTRRMRPSDVPMLVGDASKFRKRTGWKPLIPFEKTLEDILNYWRSKVGAS